MLTVAIEVATADGVREAIITYWEHFIEDQLVSKPKSIVKKELAANLLQAVPISSLEDSSAQNIRSSSVERRTSCLKNDG